MIRRLLAASVFMFAVSVYASSDNPVFMSPVGDNFLGTAKEVVAVKNNGDSVVGDVRSITMIGSKIKNISIKDASGNKTKFVPEDLILLKWKLSKLARMATIAENASKSINSAINTDYGYLYDIGYAVWDKVPNPENESDALLLQVLNPTYSNLLKVYATPEFVTTNFKKDELADEYIVVKNGKSMLIKDKKYKKAGFNELFGDCPEMIQKYPQKEIDWDDFPKHILEYTTFMKK
jgi:hypothetical protein